jgi:hypothetical protein
VALRVLDEPALFAHADRRGGAGQDAGVDPDDADPAAVEQAEPGDHRVAGDVLGGAPLGQRERADLEPRPGVDQQVDPLPHRQPPGRPVPGQAVGTAHRQRLLAPGPERGDAVGHQVGRLGDGHRARLTDG